MNQTESEDNLTGLEIAVIGMAGRFPGAGDIDEFWDNLVEGRECFAYLSDDELREEGVRDKLVKNPLYVRACGWLEGVDCFDASFFGYTPLEAEIMDPQLRIFHECVLGALGNAGYDPYSYRKPIGFYAGASANLDWQARVKLSGKSATLGWFASKQLTDKDFLSTRIAHRLNLKGPAITLDTACSTSLVAVHMACQGLLSGDCDMALAGGVSVSLLAKLGYTYQEGMLNSPDGHCRAFDARAKGTNFGNAAALVVLKRLEDALEDGDTVHAVVKGSAVNNDGHRKAAYTAPSIEGQSAVIRNAQKMAEVEPETIGYVETHGTGTPLGDPVEIESLKIAFNTGKKHFCKIGSVKTNVGHLEIAAGVTGFIKTVLTLKHRLIPPSLFFEKPNPKIDFENSPFVVNKALTAWEPENGRPLRAGVSSFGIGGTNAHVVLEEWTGEGRGTRDGGWQPVVLSAKTGTALDKMTENLGGYLKKNPGIDIADAAYTLQVGRKVHQHRRMLVCDDAGKAAALLSDTDSGKIISHRSQEDNPSVVFMFPGQGAQYLNMGRGLYEEEPLFRDRMDRCFKLLAPLMEENFKEILYPPATGESYSEKLNRPEIAPVAIFVFEYALTELLLFWGIKPHALIGYSFGEYAAACVSGVFSLEDALKLVVFRGKLLRKMPAGAMLSVPLSKKDLTPLLLSNPDVSPAIDNGPSCVVSGTVAAVRSFEKQMKEKKLMCMSVPVPHALHSPALAAVSREFEAFFSTLTLNKPEIPYISNVTGNWITDREAVDPAHWSKHLRQTVRFADGMKVLLKESGGVFVEVGPGRDIGTLTARHIETHGSDRHRVVNMVKHPHQTVPDIYHLNKGVGKLWLYGHPVDWAAFHSPEKGRRKRVPLPTYPFERQRFWIERVDTSKIGAAGRKPDMADWFYIPSWKRSTPFLDEPTNIQGSSHWLIFAAGVALDKKLKEQLKKAGRQVTVVSMGAKFEKIKDGEYTLDPREDDHYSRLIDELPGPFNIVHLWGLRGQKNGNPPPLDIPSIGEALNAGYYSLLNLARAAGGLRGTGKTRIVVVSHKMHDVTGGGTAAPERTSVLGPVGVIPTEYANLDCRAIDICLPEPGAPEEEKLVGRLLKEFLIDNSERIVAYRDDYRWVRAFEPVFLESPDNEKHKSRLKMGGVYLITGGLGGIGFALAEYLAEHTAPKLVLTGRTPIPPRDKWARIVSAENGDNKVAPKIKKILRLEEMGAQVLVFNADAGDPVRMKEVIDRTMETFGRLDGVIHSAGVADGAMIQRRTREDSENVFTAKIKGAVVLDGLLKDIPLDFLVYCSSIASVLPQFGQVAYCAANRFLDALADQRFRRDGTYTVSMNWDRWRGVGIAVLLEERHRQLAGDELGGGISLEEGVETFLRIIASSLPRVVVSPGDLDKRIESRRKADFSSFMNALSERSDDSSTHPSKTGIERPDLDTGYVAPRDVTEQAIARIWQTLFGFKRVGVTDDFIELGGDSLKAITMIARVHKEFNVEVPLTDFFEEPTIRLLARHVTGGEKGTHSVIPMADEKEYYSLSSAQKRLFLLEKLGNLGTAYNIINAVNIAGPLDVERLEDIFQTLVRRHESFRTSFHLSDLEPKQRVHRDLEFKIEFFDLPPEKRGEAMEILEIFEGFVSPFDLENPPLLRVGLVKTGEEKHTLMVNMHHIISDGVSMVNFIKEFSLLYAGEPLSPLTLQYKDFSEWQNTLSTSGRMKKQENYWLAQFKEEIPVLELPLDYVRPPILGYEGEKEDLRLGVEDTAFLRAVALEEKTSLFIVVLAVYTLFMSKLSGQDDIIVGVPIVGRKSPELEPVMGMFVNTLALRNFPSGEKPFPQFLKEVTENSLRAFDNQDYPFEELVDKVALRRDTGRNPLFDTMLVNRNNRMTAGAVPDAKIPGLEITPYEFPHKTSKFDTLLELFDVGDQLHLSFEYCTGLFKKQSIQRFLRYFKTLLLSVRRDPGKNLSDLEILPEEEKQEILADFNRTGATYPSGKTIHRLFEEQVERTGGVPAVAAPGSLTYRQLNEKSGRVARLLWEKGVGAGDIVGIMAERSVEMIAGIFGILKAGAAYLPIDTDYPMERINYMLRDCYATILLSGTNELNQLCGQCEMIGLSNIGEENQVGPTQSSQPTQPDDLAYVIYTSGSTGKPKGVMIEHRSVINLLYGFFDRYPITGGHRILLKTPYSFDVSVSELFGWIPGGGALVILESGAERDPQVIIDTIALAGVTHVNFVPSMFNLFLDALTPHNISKLSRLEYIFLAGEELLPGPVNRFEQLGLKTSLENLYGPTEGTVYATGYSLSHWDGNGSISIGAPLPNVKAFILARGGRLQPPGVPGELCLGGAGLARGYLNRPELTAEKFVESTPNPFLTSVGTPAPYYRTGDLARWLPDPAARGAYIIQFLGRIDQQVKIRGFRIELGEIESKLLTHDEINEAVVITRINEDGDKYLCAYIASPGELNVSRMREYLSKELPTYMIPASFVQLKKLPLTANGKIDRKRLDLFGKQLESGTTFMLPRNEVEEKIAEIWKEVLRLDKVGIHDSYFDLGGTSFDVIKIVRLMKDEFQTDIPVVTMFRYRTIHLMANYLAQEKDEIRDRSDKIRKGENFKLARLQGRKRTDRKRTVPKN